MGMCRIYYLRGSLLEETVELETPDLVEAARTASAAHPELTAEIWLDSRKVAIVRPSWDYRLRRWSER